MEGGESVPELPEVEAVKRGLNQLVLGKTIKDIQIYWPRIITTDLALDQWVALLQGQRIEAMDRRGKYILFILSQDTLVSHLRMEGKYLFYPANQLPINKEKHTHVRFIFTDGNELHYHDVRKFGRIQLLDGHDVSPYFQAKGLGPEPLSNEFQLADFRWGLAGSSRSIKPLLLDQSLVVGLGNIYVNEVLFLAQIHPLKPANQLTESESKALFEAIGRILAQAVEAGGSTIRTYRNSLGEAGKFQQDLKVYGQAGRPCPRCGTELVKIRVQQRGTHYCPSCQHL